MISNICLVHDLFISTQTPALFPCSKQNSKLCNWLAITRPEESYRLCHVNVCDLETSSGLKKPVKEEEELAS